MRREVLPVRESWVQKLESWGFNIHDAGKPEQYWGEGASYGFTLPEIEQVEQAAASLHKMCLEAVDYVVKQYRAGNTAPLAQFEIPEAYWPLVAQSWERREPSVYGRFDFCVDGVHPPKMFEYNADTPTSVYEGAVMQYFWREEAKPQAGQFNLLHDKFIAAWKRALPTGAVVHFLGQLEVREDVISIEYLRDTCAQAGFTTKLMNINKLGYDPVQEVFLDDAERPITHAFKLYPWEWLVREDSVGAFLKSKTQWIEPIWKMLLSNKALLPLLWQLNPGHPNLLAASYHEHEMQGAYVSKPKLSREGANIGLHKDGALVSRTDGMYSKETLIYQAYAEIPSFDGYHPTIGAWIVGDEAAGMGIREDRTYVTSNFSRFVPHFIEAEG